MAPTEALPVAVPDNDPAPSAQSARVRSVCTRSFAPSMTALPHEDFHRFFFFCLFLFCLGSNTFSCPWVVELLSFPSVHFFARLPPRWRLHVPDRPPSDTVIFNSRCGVVLPHLRLDRTKSPVGCWTVLALLSHPGGAYTGRNPQRRHRLFIAPSTWADASAGIRYCHHICERERE